MSPYDHTSACGPMGASADVCSGAIQAGVPRAAIVASEAVWIALAIPKSRSFTVNGSPAWRERARKTFAGFRSRCTIPIACAALRACATCSRMAIATGHANAPARRSSCESVVPSSSSITM
jgi:hypothetical protein